MIDDESDIISLKLSSFSEVVAVASVVAAAVTRVTNLLAGTVFSRPAWCNSTILG